MEEHNFYSRQTVLKEIGEIGQEKLKQSKFLIVGAGGLGHPVAIYLAAAGVGKISIIDFDRVEPSNLNRQICFTREDIGKKKSEVLCDKLKTQNPFITVEGITKKLQLQNISKTINSFDIILDCSDNFNTKFLLHDFAWWHSKDLIQASIYQYEGQIQVFNYSKDKNTGCLRCLWNNKPENHCVQNCSEAGVIGVVAGSLGTLQALESIKLLLDLGSKHNNTTIMVDLLNLELQKIKWKKLDDCKLCSKKISIQDVYGLHTPFYKDYELPDLNQPNMILVDIREKNEIVCDDTYDHYKIIYLPLSEIKSWKKEINPDKKYLFLCQKGIRSSQIVKEFRNQKLTNCFSLHGGIDRMKN